MNKVFTSNKDCNLKTNHVVSWHQKDSVVILQIKLLTEVDQELIQQFPNLLPQPLIPLFGVFINPAAKINNCESAKKSFSINSDIICANNI